MNLKNQLKLKDNPHFLEVLSGSAITFVLKILGVFLSYLVILMISRKYGADGVGVYSIALNVMTFLAIFATIGTDISIVRFASQFDKIWSMYLGSIQVTIPFSILLSASLFFFSDLIAVDIFHDASYKEALELVAIIVPFYALLNINIELIRGMKKLHISEFLRNVNRPLINVVLLFIIGMYVTDKLLPIYTLGAGIALGFIFSVAFIFKNITKSLNRKVVKKEILTTSFPMFLSTLSGFLIGAIPLFILQIFTTSSEVGVFSVAYKLSLIVGISLMILNTILAPKISELFWADDHKNLQAVISRSVRIIFYVSLFTAVVIMTFNKQILNVFGDEFLGGEIALGLMIIGQVFNVATGSVGIFMNMTGNQRVLMNVAIMVTFFSFLVSYIVVPKYGINGAALVSMISTILINAIPAYYAKLRLNYIVYYVPRFFIKK